MERTWNVIKLTVVKLWRLHGIWLHLAAKRNWPSHMYALIQLLRTYSSQITFHSERTEEIKGDFILQAQTNTISHTSTMIIIIVPHSSAFWTPSAFDFYYAAPPPLCLSLSIPLSVLHIPQRTKTHTDYKYSLKGMCVDYCYSVFREQNGHISDRG